MAMSDGEAIGYTIMIGCWIFAMAAIGNAEEIVAGCCCFGFIGLGIAHTGYEKRKRAMQTIYIQPQPIYVQQPVYAPAPAPTPAPAPAPAPPEKTDATPSKEQLTQWAMDARNLEMARDWEGAAQAYQKAGLYAEAGRVRQAHLEDEDKVVLNIDRIGDTVLHDSVMIGDSQNKEKQDED